MSEHADDEIDDDHQALHNGREIIIAFLSPSKDSSLSIRSRLI